MTCSRNHCTDNSLHVPFSVLRMMDGGLLKRHKHSAGQSVVGVKISLEPRNCTASRHDKCRCTPINYGDLTSETHTYDTKCNFCLVNGLKTPLTKATRRKQCSMECLLISHAFRGVNAIKICNEMDRNQECYMVCHYFPFFYEI